MTAKGVSKHQQIAHHHLATNHGKLTGPQKLFPIIVSISSKNRLTPKNQQNDHYNRKKPSIIYTICRSSLCHFEMLKTFPYSWQHNFYIQTIKIKFIKFVHTVPTRSLCCDSFKNIIKMIGYRAFSQAPGFDNISMWLDAKLKNEIIK